MTTLRHDIRLTLDGFTCTCDRGERIADDVSDRVKRSAAARHQLAVIMYEAGETDEVATSCLACGAEITVPINGTDRLATYYDAIRKPCNRCGMTPAQAVTLNS